METGRVKEAGLADGRSVNAVFALLFGAVEGVINAPDKLLQRFKMPLSKTAAERNPQVFFPPDALFNGGTPRFQLRERGRHLLSLEDYRELFSTITVN